MANIKKMYKGISNSPVTKILADITENDTYIELADISIIPNNLPNYLVIYSDKGISETVEVTEIIGNIITVIRGVDGTISCFWPKDTKVSRNFTNGDYEKLCDNIEELNNEKIEINIVDNNNHLVNITKKGENTDYNGISNEFYNNIVESFKNKLELTEKEIETVNIKENGEITEYVAISKSKYEEIMEKINKPVNEIINPNILHNSNFLVADLVNQRGSTSYNTLGYCFDGWNLSGNIGMVDLTGENVVFSKTDDIDASLLNFEIERRADYIGKTLTFSLLCKADEGASFSLSLTDGDVVNACVGEFVGTGQEERVYITHTFETGFTTCTISLNQAMEMTLFYAKVEESNEPTKFIDDSIMDKFRKCQRYLYVAGLGKTSMNYGCGINVAVNTANFILNLQVPMRLSVPTLVNYGTKGIYLQGSYGTVPVTSLEIMPNYTDAKSCLVTMKIGYSKSAITTNSAIIFCNSSSTKSYILLSCEI